ncbi:MAG TPA: hypothetical protein DCQ30_10375 [Acidimicrobiaceae bacterium]|nr:hypothetical protein [Acidimicrobiaceae bacterium]
MATATAEFEFRAEDPDMVLTHMARLGDAHRGWINLQPGIREEDTPPAPTALGFIFSSSRYEVPMCTWVAGREGRHGVEADSLGIQHGSGPRAVRRLAGMELPLPEGWRWVQDNPLRGLVVRTPPGTDHADQLRWLLQAGSALSKVPLTGDWRALVYEGR